MVVVGMVYLLDQVGMVLVSIGLAAFLSVGLFNRYSPLQIFHGYFFKKNDHGTVTFAMFKEA